MPRQIALRIFLVFAVLLAQQTALAHDFWHATPKATTDKFCDLHDLLGTVLGVAAGTVSLPAFLALAEPGFMPPAVVKREAQSLTHHSRDPPLVS